MCIDKSHMVRKTLFGALKTEEKITSISQNFKTKKKRKNFFELFIFKSDLKQSKLMKEHVKIIYKRETFFLDDIKFPPLLSRPNLFLFSNYIISILFHSIGAHSAELGHADEEVNKEWEREEGKIILLLII